MISSKELRRIFVEFFKERGHQHVPSSPLIPPDDPTLLFTSAGMVQFKPLWAGMVDPLPYRRAVTVQTCFRAGGKGSDLENVGKTLRHLTFFEMLGNFSFGDYFKREAIQWAWEFVTQVVKMPRERLYVSVHYEDEEAYKIWNEEIGLSSDRIVALGDEANFWGPAGETGACGPCSEIYFDMGEERSCGKPTCTVGCDCERYLEFWNMVFPQFDQQPDGTRLPLKNRGIDTGMGLERLACIVQNKPTLYETDLLYPLVSSASELIGVNYKRDLETTLSMNVVADHIRGLVFVLSEGVVPSNEGRGYVLRRVLRRAVRHYKKLGYDEPCLYRLVDVVIDIMGDEYPQIKSHPEQVKKVIRLEEERFHRTLSQGIELLNKIIEDVKKSGEKVIDGKEVFRLYDTYGFPVDLTLEIAAEEGVDIDRAGFERCLAEQKRIARASWKGAQTFEKLETQLKDIIQEYGRTRFVGYGQLETRANIVAILDLQDHRLTTIEKGKEARLVLDESPFYGEAGGQVGDTGRIYLNESIFEVKDTQRTPGNIFIHTGVVREGKFKVGDIVNAEVDRDRRLAIMRHHTATHLLQGALKRIVGSHITQSGSLVHPEYLRFDFTHIEPLSSEQIYEVERMVNQKIMEDIPVEAMELPIEEAKKLGAIAPFGEKYGTIVRVIKIGEFSMEFCGGTHLDRTGQIGFFKIISESSIATGIRRIEAKAGLPAFEEFHKATSTIAELSARLSVPPEQLISQVEALLSARKELKKEIQKLHQQALLTQIDDIIASAQSVNNVKIVTYKLYDVQTEALRNLADSIKSKVKNNVVIMLAGVDKESNKVQLICSVSADIADKLPANKLVNEVAKQIGGGGGGRAQMAQAGGKHPEKLDDAFQLLRQSIAELLS
ncbi:alanine--tRNA ligase [Candidatus Sumerlaeota bacterium]|nr:alanine--tRNA ligase [Candidatus Sumerlaeota bacterium]